MGRIQHFVNRHFGILAVLVFLGLYGALLTKEWAELRREAIFDAQWHAQSMAEVLQREVDPANGERGLFAALNASQKSGHAELDRQIRHLIGHLGIREVKIYDPSGRVVYATESRLIGGTPSRETALEAALRGQRSTEIIRAGEYEAAYGLPAPGDMAEVYVPLRAPGEEQVPFVFETYQDFREFRARVRRSLVSSGISLAALLGVSLAVLAFLLRRKQALERQVESLEQFLPICSFCKRIRVEETGRPAQWVCVESYFGHRDAVEFSHGVCDECMREHYPEFVLQA